MSVFLPLSVSLQMNDYVAAYHDSVLLIGEVMREILKKTPSEIQQMEFVNVNYFRNISFNGKEGGRDSGRKGEGELTVLPSVSMVGMLNK